MTAKEWSMFQRSGTDVSVNADAYKAVTGEFEVVVRGLTPTAVPGSPDPTSGGAVALTNALKALIRSVADAQLAADVAAAEAMAVSANGRPAEVPEEPTNHPSAWDAGVLPSFYQIAEVTVDLNMAVHFLPPGSPEAATSEGSDTAAAGSVVRVLLRQVAPPPGVMAKLPMPPPNTATTQIPFD
jgi:hypothetical protein